VPEKRFRQNI